MQDIIEIEKHLQDLCFGNKTSIYPKEEIRKIWDSIRNNEELLSKALKIDTQEVLTPTPTIWSLILMDYKNVDPLAYEVVIKLIYSEYNSPFGKILNPFTGEYKHSLLTTSLFNKELILDKEKINRLLAIACSITNEEHSKDNGIYLIYWMLTHPIFKDYQYKIYYDISKVKKEYLEKLLQNYEERAKLRKLTKLPF